MKLKLKELLKETVTWKNRKFGDRLPTLKDYQEDNNKKNGIEEEKLEEARSGVIPAKMIDSKTWMKMKYDIREQLDELVKIGEDYGVFESAQHTARTLKKIRKMWGNL